MKHIILMRGLAREAAHWSDFPELLQQAIGDNCRIHLIDFPGCGKYYQQPALSSVAAMTDHARTQIEIASVIASGEPIYLLGISMGGMVAVDWMQTFPAEVRGVVLINSSFGDQPIWWRLRPAAWPTILLALLLPMKPREALVLHKVSNNSARYSQHLQQWLAIQQLRPVKRSAIVAMLRAAAQFRPRAGCSVEGLVLTSNNDRMVSTRASDDIARRFNWPLARHPWAGHDLPMDDARWVVNAVAQRIKAPLKN